MEIDGVTLSHPDKVLFPQANITKAAMAAYYGMTAVAPYSLRANQAAGIATPISWEELARKSLQPQSFTIKNIHQRLKNFKDPWKGFV